MLLSCLFPSLSREEAPLRRRLFCNCNFLQRRPVPSCPAHSGRQLRQAGWGERPWLRFRDAAEGPAGTTARKTTCTTKYRDTQSRGGGKLLGSYKQSCKCGGGGGGPPDTSSGSASPAGAWLYNQSLQGQVLLQSEILPCLAAAISHRAQCRERDISSPTGKKAQRKLCWQGSPAPPGFAWLCNTHAWTCTQTHRHIYLPSCCLQICSGNPVRRC